MTERIVTLDIEKLNEDWLSTDTTRRDAALRLLAFALYHCVASVRTEVERQIQVSINPALFEQAKSIGRDYRHILIW